MGERRLEKDGPRTENRPPVSLSGTETGTALPSFSWDAASDNHSDFFLSFEIKTFPTAARSVPICLRAWLIPSTYCAADYQAWGFMAIDVPRSRTRFTGHGYEKMEKSSQGMLNIRGRKRLIAVRMPPTRV
jgi:hypothetical protein